MGRQPLRHLMKYQKLKGTVTIPPQPHRKEQILPWANAVTKAIQQLRDRLAPVSPNTTTRDTLPPLWVSLFYDDPDWKFRVNPGYATSQNINGGVLYHTPTLGGTSLEDDPQPDGTLPATDAYVYLKILTTNKGVITGTPTIESTESEETTQHHVPPNAANPSGVTGGLLVAHC